jgi:hypothetical protein
VPTKIHELVKTYKLINDPNSPNWSVKFVGAVAGVVLLVAAVGAIAWASMGHAPGGAEPNQALASTTDNPDGTRTDYVGFDPTHFDATLGPDLGKVDSMVSDWKTAHPGATILSQAAVWNGSHVIGYDITYR